MRNCRRCGRSRPAEEFLAGKAKRQSTSCAACRRKAAEGHRRNYYARLPPDERHRLTHQRRARSYGVAHAPYSRTEIIARWGNLCAYCWVAPVQHLDHVIPLSRGGEDKESNILPACAPCNLSKGALTLAEWMERDAGTGLSTPF